jgi:hypothetical protein
MTPVLRGVLPVAPTVFHDDESLDLDGQRRVTEFAVQVMTWMVPAGNIRFEKVPTPPLNDRRRPPTDGTAGNSSYLIGSATSARFRPRYLSICASTSRRQHRPPTTGSPLRST